MKKKEVQATISKHEVQPTYVKSILSAFLFGGILSIFGQGLVWFYENVLGASQENAPTFMIVTLILLASILTGIGVYDKFGQIAKAGGFIPITGFANSLTASAMEGRSEGVVLGIATGILKVAGLIIVVAVMSGFVFGLIRYFLAGWGIAPALDHHVFLIMEVAS